LLHIQALHLDQILHVVLASTAPHVISLILSFAHLLGHDRLVTLLHLILHVVEDAVEVDWVELDWHFNSRILLEVDKRLLTLLRIHHSSGTFNSLTLLNSDLFAVEDHQLNESFDHDHAVVWLTSDRIVDQGQVEQVGQLSQFLNLKQLLNPIIRNVKGL